MAVIRVAVSGALGRMGQEVARAVSADPVLVLVGGIDVRARAGTAAGWAHAAPLFDGIDTALGQARPDVVVDFTTPGAVRGNVFAAVAAGVRPVVGTTGLSAEDLAAIRTHCNEHKVGAVIAPNFAIGAVLMMQFARLAAPYVDYAEVIELHHEQKLDAPSGTAVATARGMLEQRGRDFVRPVAEKELVPGSRGANIGGISVHAVRMAGLVAHQEVLLGTLGQTLSIRHDTTSREAFMPGVILATKKVMTLDGLVYGLEHLLELRLA